MGDFSSRGQISLTVFSICGFTDMACDLCVLLCLVARFLQAAIVLHEVLEIDSSDRVVYFAALQQFIFDAGRAILERMTHHWSHHPHEVDFHP